MLDVQQELLEDTVAAYQRTLELTQNRYKAGVVGKVDVVQAETQLRSTQAQAIDIGVQRAQLEHAIALLIGKPPATFSLAARAARASRCRTIPLGVPSELLERRPDIAAAERRVAAANAQIGVAQAAFFPALTLSAARGSRARASPTGSPRRAASGRSGRRSRRRSSTAGLRRAQTDQAIAAYDATVADYRQTVLTGFQEVEDNLAALRILEEEAERAGRGGQRGARVGRAHHQPVQGRDRELF